MGAPADAIPYDEPTLITCAQQGDRQAFGELVRRHRTGVVNVVYRMCGDPALAEEAAQEAFLRAWQQLDRYRPRHAFRSWVYRIALNAAVDALRRERPTTRLPTEGALPWIAAIVVGLPIFIVIMALPLAVLGGLAETFQPSTWTLTYRELLALEAARPASGGAVPPAPAAPPLPAA